MDLVAVIGVRHVSDDNRDRVRSAVMIGSHLLAPEERLDDGVGIVRCDNQCCPAALRANAIEVQVCEAADDRAR